MPDRAAPRSALVGVGWAVAALVVAVVHSRLWASPNLAFLALITEGLGTNPFGSGLDGDYLLTNLLGPVVARATGQSAAHEYARLHLVVALVGIGGVLVVAARRFGPTVASALAVVVGVSPALTTTLTWLGQPDAFTLPLGLGLAVVRRRAVVVALAVLAGLAHPEQAVVMAAVAGVVRATLADDAPRRPPWRLAAVEVLVGVVGVAAGRAVTEVYLRVNDIVVTRPRTSYLDLGWSGFVDHHGQDPAVLVYALWGPLWLVWAATLAWRFVGRGRPDRDADGAWLTLGALAVLGLLPVAVTLDETRVYAMITSPLLVLAAVLAVNDLRAVSRRALPMAGVALLAVTLALPGVFTAGRPAWSRDLPPAEIARFLRDGSHPGDDLTTWLLSPFDFVIPRLDG